MPDRPPTYEELVTMLRSAPPQQAVDDQRYWQWRAAASAMLARVK